MKIRNISCTQFAGIRDKSLLFEDGINIVYGKNESGKSTLINLISRTLFQKSRLDGRTDKEFCNLYFPAGRKGSTATGDFADGKISIETENGTYTLLKEWGVDARCMLSAPEGVIRDPESIDELLKSILIYGEGVYTQMLLTSQKNSDSSLQTLLDASKKTDEKQEITNAVTQAFAESGSVSVEAIGDAIAAKIKEIAGLHWDFERNMPVKKRERWSTGLGEILKAYYVLEDAKEVLSEISELEAEVDRACDEYKLKDAEVAEAETDYEKFNTFANRLEVQSERRAKIKTLEADTDKYNAVLHEWPNLIDDLKNAKKLQEEREKRNILDKYERVKSIFDETTKLKEELEKSVCPGTEEILKVKNNIKEITALENKLCGMNIATQIRLMGENTVEAKTLRTGEVIDITDENTVIDEAVVITVPGVMELTLAPSDADVDDISARIKLKKSENDKVYTKYFSKSVEDLEQLTENYNSIKIKSDNANSRLLLALNGSDYEQLKTVAASITANIREQAEIDADIQALCGKSEISLFIAGRETLVEKNTEDYGSIDELKLKISAMEEELEKAKASLCTSDDIPYEYLKIPDPAEHLNKLKTILEQKRQLRENALTEKIAASSKLETYKANLNDDPSAALEIAERVFNEQKELLEHWLHIEEVFNAKKEELSDNPMQDISERFADYLAVISGDRVSSEFPERDKLNINIYSDNRLLDYGKLSEGTKETVSLAFRLAVLDHLFPNGGGVVVFDDPFTDMDAERTARSCELIKTFAKRHQVIFLTCKEEYIDILSGNIIRM